MESAPPSVLPASSAAVAVAHHPPLDRLAAYVELTKPRMNFLVVLTTMIGFLLASRHMDWLLLLHTLLGTALTAAGASALNQYMERRYDGLMPRTANRPLPALRLTPAEAASFGITISIAGVLYLLLLVNLLTSLLGAFTLLSYVAVYTPLKRRTPLCTIVGAIPGAIPPVMGWTAATGALHPAAAALFAILFVWQIPHFLAIAILYCQQYAAAGFQMLPVVDPDLRSTARQMIIYAIAMVPASLLPVIAGVSGGVYLVSAILLGGAFGACSLVCALRRTRNSARWLFIASIIYLPLLLGMMMLDRVPL